MELIIKPTEVCNFSCTFCSSTEIAESGSSLLTHEQIFSFLKRFPNTSTIIINGGDPLVLHPHYYWKIINFLEENEMNTTLSFTTNLWDFYKRPDKWIDLLKHERVGVATSFNYGSTRQIKPGEVYTEEIFWKVSDLFLEKIGYRPDFISVITDENEHTAIDNVRLAKRMGVECKLNYAMASGRESKSYQLSKIYEIYLEILELDLQDWEFNTKQMMKRLKGRSTICPQNRDCDSGIRCLQPDGDYYSCGAFGDDKLFDIDFESEMKSETKVLPLKNNFEIFSLKDECLTCPMFDICNGCKKTIFDMKSTGMVEEHCSLMKKIAPRILKSNGLDEEV